MACCAREAGTTGRVIASVMTVLQRVREPAWAPRLPNRAARQARSSPGAPHRGGGLPASEPGLDAGAHDLAPRLTDDSGNGPARSRMLRNARFRGALRATGLASGSPPHF